MVAATAPEIGSLGRGCIGKTMNIHAPGPTGRIHPPLIGLAPLCRLAFDGADLKPLGQHMRDRIAADPKDAAALMDLSKILQLAGDRAGGLAAQAAALQLQRVYRHRSATGADRLRLLAFVVPGDFMANTPVEFLLEGSDVALDLCFLDPEQPACPSVSAHDAAFVAVSESDHNMLILKYLSDMLRAWPRPVLNAPERIARLSREESHALLHGAPSLEMPAVARVGREQLALLVAGTPVRTLLKDGRFPIIARPAGSHAGSGLARLDDPAAVAAYLAGQGADAFQIARFVDYRGADGHYRKARVVFIGGRPFACHMAVSSDWMVHYLNAGMTGSAAKRAEEAAFMARFDEDFAARHARAFSALAERTGLDYFGIDCAETPEGKLLVFEVDVAMIVHAMDPPDLFPYKPPQMRRVFGAFCDMLHNAAATIPA